MRTVSLKLPDDLDARLESAAKGRGSSKSEVVRKALLRFLPRPGGKTAASFLERAGTLVGCVEGPTDLSTDPRHLRGYGE